MRTTLPSQLNGHGWIINLARRHDFGTPLLLPGTDSLHACSPQPSFPKSKVENRKCHGFGTGLYTTLSRPKIAKCLDFNDNVTTLRPGSPLARGEGSR